MPAKTVFVCERGVEAAGDSLSQSGACKKVPLRAVRGLPGVCGKGRKVMKETLNLTDPHTVRVIIVLGFMAGIIVGGVFVFLGMKVRSAARCADCVMEGRVNQ